MKKLLLGIFIFFSFLSFSEPLDISSKYKKLGLNETTLSYEVFKKAYLGYLQIADKNSGVLVVIDYSKPSDKKRFFVFNLDEDKIIFNTRVSHAKNSGMDFAINFSNDPNSYESSLGFYLTTEEYSGKYGTSLRLKGLEENINSNAEERAIVIHGSDVVEDKYLKEHGHIGRSLGCPMLPNSKVKDVIDYIKDSRVVFIFANDEYYFEESKFFK